MALEVARTIRAARGSALRARSWQTEAALRMLMNNLDPEVAERPDELVVYGGIGKAARDWPAYEAIVAELERLEDDETLAVQSGKPVGVFRSHPDAPRVLIANSNLVPHWATWEHFNELDRKGLMMYGQMTAGSWIYIGSQGIVQGTYETFAELGRRHYGGDLSGRWILTAGLGGMGGAQPLAATMAGASMLAIECDPSRVEKRLATRYLDRLAGSLDEALALLDEARRSGVPVSVAVVGNAAELVPELLRRGVRPDAVTDQTSAHDPGNGYLPLGWTLAGVARAAPLRPGRRGARRRSARWWRTSRRWSRSTGWACRRSTTATTCARWRTTPARAMPSPSRASCRRTSGRCSSAASGRSAGWRSRATRTTSARPTPRSRSCCRTTAHLHRWLDMAQQRIAFQGLPARICWIGLGERDRVGLAFNEMVARGELKAPIVIGRDHLDSGSVASPNRETEGMRDGSDAVSDWPLLNAMLSVAGGATWVSIHHGGGVGMGYSQHAGLVIVADGTPAAAARIARVLWNDPASGVARHADAGYESAIACAREHGLRLPMREPR